MDIASEGLNFISHLDVFGGISRKWLVRRDESTSEKYGTIPTLRPLSQLLDYGVIVVDKPPGPSSHEVVAWVKEMLGVSKAGHGGTLEPYQRFCW